MKRLLFCFWVLTLLSSCSGGKIVRDALDKAEKSMQISPEQSLVILQSIPQTKITDTRQRARYALLMSQALDKNYIDIDSDSLTRKAVEYYDCTRDRKSRMLAYYYNGLVMSNAHRYTESAISFEKAIIEASLLSDYLYLGLSNRSLAEIMNLTLNFSGAIQYEKKAINYFQQAGASLYELYGWLSLAIAYSNNKQYDKAIALSDSLFYLSGTKVLQDSFEQIKAVSIIESRTRDYLGPVDIYRRVDKQYFHLSDYGYYAYALDMIGQHDSADWYLKRAFELSTNRVDSAAVKVFQARINNHRGNYKLAYQLLDKATMVQDSMVRNTLRQSVSMAQKDFFNKEAQYQKLKAHNAKVTTVMISLTFLLLLISGGLIVMQIKKEKDTQLKEQMVRLVMEKEKTSILFSDNASLLGSLFSERLGHIDRLAYDYLSARTVEEKERIFKEYKRNCTYLLKDNSVFDSLEADLNKYCSDIMEKLRLEVPSIKGEHRIIISLFFAGIPTIAIQAITGKQSRKAVEMERSRLRKIIRASGAEHSDLFLEMMETKKRQPEE